MLKNWKWLRGGLLTLLVVAGGMAASISVSVAGKQAPPTPKYKLQLFRNLDVPPDFGGHYILGMNNHGSFLSVVFNYDGGLVFIRDAVSEEWVPACNYWSVYDPYPSIVASPELAASLDAAVAALDAASPGTTHKWRDVLWDTVHTQFDYATNCHALNDDNEVTAFFWFRLADGVAWSKSRGFRYSPRRYDSDHNVIPAQFIDLGVPHTAFSTFVDDGAMCINNQGDVAGYANNGGSPYQWRIGGFPATAKQHVRVPNVWVTGEYELGRLDEGPCLASDGVIKGGHAYDINENGQVIGERELHAFRYTPSSTSVYPGTYEALTELRASATSRPFGINNQGDVVGRCSATATQSHAFFCAGNTNKMTDLGTLANSTLGSIAWDINDSKQVVGFSDVSTKARSIFLWTSETGMVDLWKLIDWSQSDTLPAGTTANNISGALYINDNLFPTCNNTRSYGQISGVISGVPFILTPTN
jgi:probable HAF family extracellular repeat protein